MKNDYIVVQAEYWKEEEGVILLKKQSKRFKKSGVMIYFNCLHKFMEVRKSSWCLFMYMCEKMEEDNKISVNHQLKASFQDHVTNMGKAAYSKGAMDKGVSELIAQSFLIKTPVRGFYIVNPNHAFKSTAGNRKKVFKYLLERIDDDEWQSTNIVEAMGRVDK